MALTSPPAAPNRATDSAATFSTKADALMTWYLTNVTELTALQIDVAAKQVLTITSQTNAATSETNASTSAANSATSAQAAAASAGAALWVSGNTYGNGVAVRSPANQRIYIKITATAGGSVDPSSNATDWQLLVVYTVWTTVSTTSQTAIAGGAYLLINAAATAVTLPASPIANSAPVLIKATNGQTNTADPGANTIEGASGVMNLTNPYAAYALQFLNGSWRFV